MVLWQFPTSFRFSSKQRDEAISRLEHFLQILPSTIRHAFEFRHEACFEKDVVSLLQEHNAAIVISDSSVFPCVEILSSDFVYIRFHGPRHLYSSSYSSDELAIAAESIAQYLTYYDVYAYFNNDVSGYAIRNALTLEPMLSRGSTPRNQLYFRG